MRRPSPSGVRRESANSRRQQQVEEYMADKSTTDQQSDTSYSRSQINEEQKSEIDQNINQNQNFAQQQQDTYPNFQKRLKDVYQTIFEPYNTTLTVKYSNDDQYIAIGSQYSDLKVFNVQKEVPSYALVDPEKSQTCTCLKWCPEGIVGNTLIAGYSSGHILYWHVTSQKILHRYQEDNNPINALDISPCGQKFATGGQDGQVRLYDVGKTSQADILEAGNVAPVHNNRVYGVKFDKNNPNLLITGGWDQMILFWDIRQKETAGFLYGPKIFSDSFDIHENTLLTGSWREKDQLQLFDMRKMKKLYTIPWENYSPGEKTQSLVYCCQFSKTNPDQIVAGSTGTHEIRLFEKNVDNNSMYQCVDSYREGIEKGVYCVDFSKKKNQFTYGCGDGLFGIASIEEE